jgi:hypothetical protein
MRFLKRTCTRTFRERIFTALPALEHDRTLRALAAYLLWAARTESDIIVVPRDVLMACAGTKRTDFGARAFLERFSAEVAPLKVVESVSGEDGQLRDYHFMAGQAREVVVEWPEDVMAALAEEREIPVLERREVYFVDGAAYTRKTRAAVVAEEVKAAEKTAPHCPAAQTLRDYLNSVPTNGYAFVERNIPLVEARIRAELPEPVQSQQLAILHNIAETLKPVYKAVDGTARLYEATGGMTFIKSEYRAVLAPAWAEFDLQASQLRIAAYRWGCAPLVELFEQGRSPWVVLLRDLELGAELKPFLKTLTYGLAYGAGRDRLREEALNEAKTLCDGDELLTFETYQRYSDIVERFLAHPLIDALLEARKRAVETIKAMRAAKQPIISDVGETLKGGTPTEVLARLNQATELRLTFAAARIAMEEGILRLWQHDGFSVAFHRERDRERLEQKMMAAVEEEGRALGIRMKLERKAGPAAELKKAA